MVLAVVNQKQKLYIASRKQVNQRDYTSDPSAITYIQQERQCSESSTSRDFSLPFECYTADRALMQLLVRPCRLKHAMRFRYHRLVS
jgi:hypothetical protein